MSTSKIWVFRIKIFVRIKRFQFVNSFFFVEQSFFSKRWKFFHEKKISISFENFSANEVLNKKITSFRKLNYLKHVKFNFKFQKFSNLLIKSKNISTFNWFEFVMFSFNFFSNLNWKKNFWKKIDFKNFNHFLTFDEFDKKKSSIFD